MIPNALANIETCEEEADVITANVGKKEPGIVRQKPRIAMESIEYKLNFLFLNITIINI